MSTPSTSSSSFVFDGPQGRTTVPQDQIESLVQTGQITSGTFILKGDSNEWKTARQLFPSLFAAELAKEKASNPPVNPGSMIYAGFWQRLGALVVDTLILSIPISILCFAAAFLSAITEGFFLLLAVPIWIGCGLVALGYWPYFQASKTMATPGMKLLGIRLRTEGGAQVTLIQAVLRQFAKILSALPLYAGYFWSIGDSRRQTWHDRITGTVVVVE